MPRLHGRNSTAPTAISLSWIKGLKFIFLANREYLWQASTVFLRQEELMDHDESVRKFEHLMLKQVGDAHEAAIELEALISQMPSERSRQLAELQVQASR
jgi:hypothetical protein